MSLLQIKSLRAPLDLRREPLNTTGTQTNTATGNATYQPADDGVFTCYFNRTVVATDFPEPANAGDATGFDIKVSVYDECYIFIYETTLNATQANIRENNHICFKLKMSDTDFRRLGGCNIYVHVVINNPNATADNHVQFRATFSENYHETIKHVHVYDEKKVDRVYWSTQQAFPAAGEEDPVRENITLNEDAYIHVWTSGLWGKNVAISIYERGGNKLLARIDTPMGQNRKVVVVSMKYLLACYCNKMGTTYNEEDPIDLRFYVEANRTLYEPIARPELMLLPIGGIRNQPQERNPPRENPLIKKSVDLHLESTMGNQNLSTVNNGSVFIGVDNGEAGIVEPDRYRDFLIGMMCHIEGVGKRANYHNNTNDDDAKFTIYPFHIYKIMLSDLVACGLVTLEEAIYLTTKDHNMKELEDQSDLEERLFDKTNAPLKAATPNQQVKQMINIFRDNSYRKGGNNQAVNLTNRANIRKLLSQVQISQNDETQLPGNDDLRFVCRDAWQKVSKNRGSHTIRKIHRRNDAARYSSNKECPFGDFFITFKTGDNYTSYISHYQNNCNIDFYNQTQIHPQSPNISNSRGGIALHNGAAASSTGCITFNLAYGSGTNTSLDDILYPNGRKNNNKMLNFICIDERHAIGINPDSETYNGEQISFYRFYDLIEPDDNINKNMYVNSTPSSNPNQQNPNQQNPNQQNPNR